MSSVTSPREVHFKTGKQVARLVVGSKADQPSVRIRVAIIEDDRPTREGLGMLINGTPGYQCVGTYPSVEEALRRIGHDAPDVLLLDIHLPGMSGSEGVRSLE